MTSLCCLYATMDLFSAYVCLMLKIGWLPFCLPLMLLLPFAFYKVTSYDAKDKMLVTMNCLVLLLPDKML